MSSVRAWSSLPSEDTKSLAQFFAPRTCDDQIKLLLSAHKYQRPHQLRSAKMFLQRSWVCSTSSAVFTIMMHLMHSNRPYELRMILMHHMILMRFQPFHLSVTLLSSEYTSISILIFFTLLNLIPLQLAKLILRLLIVLNIIESIYYSMSPPDKSGTCTT